MSSNLPPFPGKGWKLIGPPEPDQPLPEGIEWLAAGAPSDKWQPYEPDQYHYDSERLWFRVPHERPVETGKSVAAALERCLEDVDREVSAAAASLRTAQRCREIIGAALARVKGEKCE